MILIYRLFFPLSMMLAAAAVRARLCPVFEILQAFLGIGDRGVAVVDLLVDADQLLDPAATLALEVVPFPGRVVDRNGAMVTEANIVRRPRHFRVRLTEDISSDGLSMRSPIKLVRSRRRIHDAPRDAQARILSMRLVGTRTGVTRPPFGLIKSAILLKRSGLTPDTLSSFGPTAPTSGRGALRTHPRLRRFEVLNFRYFVSIWFEAFIRSSNRLAASSPRASKAAMPPSAKWVTASSSPGSRSATRST